MELDEHNTSDESNRKAWYKAWDDLYSNFKGIKGKYDFTSFLIKIENKILDPKWGMEYYSPETGQETEYEEGWMSARNSILENIRKAKKDRKLSLIFITTLPLISIVIEFLLYWPKSYGKPSLSPFIGYVNVAVFIAFGILGIYLIEVRKEGHIQRIFLVYFILAHLAYFIVFNFYPYFVGYSQWTEQVQKRSDILEIPKNQSMSDSFLVSKVGYSGLYGYIVYVEAYSKQRISPEEIPDDFDPIWFASKAISPASQWIAKTIFNNPNITWILVTFLWYILSWLISAVFFIYQILPND